MGVPSWTLGVMVPIRSALAAFVRPPGVRYFDRDTRPVAPDATLLIESSRLCVGARRSCGGTGALTVDTGFLARIELSTLGVCSWPADRLRRERARAEFRGPNFLPAAAAE